MFDSEGRVWAVVFGEVRFAGVMRIGLGLRGFEANANLSARVAEEPPEEAGLE